MMAEENTSKHASFSYGTDEDALRRRKEGYGLAGKRTSLKDRLAAFEKKASSSALEEAAAIEEIKNKRTAGYGGGKGGKLNISAFEKKESSDDSDAVSSPTNAPPRRVGKLSDRIAAFQQGSTTADSKSLQQPKKGGYVRGKSNAGGSTKLADRMTAFERKGSSKDNLSSATRDTTPAKTQSYLTKPTLDRFYKKEESTVSAKSASSKQNEEESIKKQETSGNVHVNSQPIESSPGENKTAPIEIVPSSNDQQPDNQSVDETQQAGTKPHEAGIGGTNEESATAESLKTVAIEQVAQPSAEVTEEDDTVEEEKTPVEKNETAAVEANDDQRPASHSVETQPEIKSDEGGAAGGTNKQSAIESDQPREIFAEDEQLSSKSINIEGETKIEGMTKDETKPVAKDENPVVDDKLDGATDKGPEATPPKKVQTEDQRREEEAAAAVEKKLLEAEAAKRKEEEEVAAREAEKEKKRLKAEEAKRKEEEQVAAREAEKVRLAEEARLEKERLAAEKAEQERLAREQRVAEKEKILRQKEEERLREEERIAALEEQRIMEQSYAEFTTIKADLTPPRELTEDEVETLRSILKTQVESHPKFNVLHDDQDCMDLIDYTFDMIVDLESVSHIVSEVEFMDFSCFNEEVAERFGKCLSKYFSDLR